MSRQEDLVRERAAIRAELIRRRSQRRIKAGIKEAPTMTREQANQEIVRRRESRQSK